MKVNILCTRRYVDVDLVLTTKIVALPLALPVYRFKLFHTLPCVTEWRPSTFIGFPDKYPGGDAEVF